MSSHTWREIDRCVVRLHVEIHRPHAWPRTRQYPPQGSNPHLQGLKPSTRRAARSLPSQACSHSSAPFAPSRGKGGGVPRCEPRVADAAPLSLWLFAAVREVAHHTQLDEPRERSA